MATINNLEQILLYSDNFLNYPIIKRGEDFQLANLQLDTHLFVLLESMGKLKHLSTNIDRLHIDQSCVKYSLYNLDFNTAMPHFKRLAIMTENKKFNKQEDLQNFLTKYGYECEFDYSQRHLSHAPWVESVRTLYISKDKFKLQLPYQGSHHGLLRHNSLFSRLVEIICKVYLPNLQFKYKLSDKELKQQVKDLVPQVMGWVFTSDDGEYYHV